MPLDGTTFEQQDDVLDVLQRARERVARPGGWCQGRLFNDEQVCLVGALLDGMQKGFNAVAFSFAQRNAVILLEDTIPDHCCSLATYNDRPGRTQAEIVAMVDYAIAIRKAELQTGGSNAV